MTRTNTVALAAALVATCLGSPTPSAQGQTAKPGSSGYVDANGIRYYFEVHGRGEVHGPGDHGTGVPILLLHGGLGHSSLFAPGLSELSKMRTVIAVDLHGHGRTELGDRKISPIDIGDDLAVIVRALGLSQVDAMGYSFGGTAALRLAIQHPTLVRRLVVISAPYAQSGWFPEMLPQQAALSAAAAEQMKGSPMYESYMAVAPRPQDFPRLLDAMGELMRQSYDWSQEVKTLAMPVMLVVGDGDMIRPEHTVEFYHLLGGGLKDAGWQREHMAKNRLAILPDVTHYEMADASALVPTVLPFLNAPRIPQR